MNTQVLSEIQNNTVQCPSLLLLVVAQGLLLIKNCRKNDTNCSRVKRHFDNIIISNIFGKIMLWI